MLHNDLKPENILLADDTPNSAIKVADFGLARPVARFADGLQPLQPYGTLGFTAPEVETCHQCTPASDMYGIGAVLYYMLCGDTHFYCQQGMWQCVPLFGLVHFQLSSFTWELRPVGSAQHLAC